MPTARNQNLQVVASNARPVFGKPPQASASNTACCSIWMLKQIRDSETGVLTWPSAVKLTSCKTSLGPGIQPKQSATRQERHACHQLSPTSTDFNLNMSGPETVSVWMRSSSTPVVGLDTLSSTWALYTASGLCQNLPIGHTCLLCIRHRLLQPLLGC